MPSGIRNASRMNRLAIIALLALIAGCSGSQQAASTAASSAPADASIAPATTDAVPAAASTLPVYPGATVSKLPGQVASAKFCGTSMAMKMYQSTNSDGAAIVKWYDDKLPGSIESMVERTPGQIYEILEPNGADGVVVMNMGSPGTFISLMTFTPALSPDILAIYRQAASEGEHLSDSVKAQIKAKCGTAGPSF